MTIGEIIKVLEKYRDEHGDVEIFYENSDGRTTWASSYKPVLSFQNHWFDNTKRHYIAHLGY